MDVPERVGIIRADWQQRDLGQAARADVLESVEVSAVTRVINAAALVFEDKTAITAVLVVNGTGAPVFARSQGHLPVGVRKPLPPLQLNDPAKTQVSRQVAHAPGHHPDLGRRQALDRGSMKVIEMRVG